MAGEHELGKALREATDKLIRKHLDEFTERFGSDVEAWAQRAAADAVRKAAEAAAAPAVESIAYLRQKNEDQGATLARHEAVIRAIDMPKLANDYAEVRQAQERLEKARGDILEEIAAAKRAALSERVELIELCQTMLDGRNDLTKVALAVTAEASTLKGEIVSLAETAAKAALEAHTVASRLELDDFLKTTRAVLAEVVVKAEAEIAGAIEKTQEMTKGSLASMRWCGPYAKGSVRSEGDIVTFLGATWINRGGNGQPGTNGWELMAGGGIRKS